MFVVPGRILDIFLPAPGTGVAMDSEGRLLELVIQSTPRAVSWLPGATWDSEGRLLELAIELSRLTPRVVSWLPEAAMDSEGRALESSI